MAVDNNGVGGVTGGWAATAPIMTGVIVVAHSVGGDVASSVPVLHPQTRGVCHRPLQAEAVRIPLRHDGDAPPPPLGRSVRPPPDDSYRPEKRGLAVRGRGDEHPPPHPLPLTMRILCILTCASPDGSDREDPYLPVRQTSAPIGAPADLRRRRPIFRRLPRFAPGRVLGDGDAASRPERTGEGPAEGLF